MKRREIISGWNSLSPIKKPLIRYQPWNYNPFGGESFEVFFDDERMLKKPATGWCSYYAFDENINEAKIWSNVEFLANHRETIPLEYIIIDGGWCEWGDWKEASAEKFPMGLKNFIRKIGKSGFRVGIWVSPFQVSPKSKLFREHPDWIVKKNGKQVISFAEVDIYGWKFREVKFLLNFKIPEVRNYIFSAIDRFVQEWEVGLLKLDYLYAPYLNPDLKSQEEASKDVKDVLDYVREKYPEIYTVGCGPFQDLAGRVDSAYVSENTILPRWRGVWPIDSIIHTIRLNRLKKCLDSRKELRGAFNFDPDVFVCAKDTGFSERQIEELLQIIKNVDGNLFLGDDLTKLPKERLEKYVYRLFE